MTLYTQQTQRYQRQLLLPQIGEKGQQQLANSHVTIIGVGGLGSPLALYLAGAGVGQLTLVDPDHVEISNLHRQILYRHNHLQRKKVDSAAKTLTALNPDIQIFPHAVSINDANATSLCQPAHIIADCSDNFTTRLLVNRICWQLKKPLVSAAAIRMEGQLVSFNFKEQSQGCYRCLFPEDKQAPVLNCENSGVLGPVLGVLGSLQAIEIIKYLTGQPLSSDRRLSLFDAQSLDWHDINIPNDPHCSVCAIID